MSWWWLLAWFAIFFIGLTKSGFGSGVGLMIVPMMAIAMAHVPGRSEKEALGLLLPLLILGDFVAVYQYRHVFSLDILRKLLPATVVGVLVGGALLYLVHSIRKEDVAKAVIRIDIGLESVLLVSLHWYRLWRLAGNVKTYVPKRWHNHVVGASAGISSTIAHAAGPIIAVYLLPQRLERQLFVGTCAIYFFVLNTAKLPVYCFNHSFRGASPLFSIRFAPLVLAGALFGVWVNRRMNDKVFSQIVYVATFLLGAYILFDGCATLARSL